MNFSIRKKLQKKAKENIEKKPVLLQVAMGLYFVTCGHKMWTCGKIYGPASDYPIV